MRIKAIYRKNLKMSEGKLAAQVFHAINKMPLIQVPKDVDVVVLGVSDKKFNDLVGTGLYTVHKDKGLTEVSPGEATTAATIDFKDAILYNAIQTPDGTILESWFRHDFKCHTDANGTKFCVDGGLVYLRRVCEPHQLYKELSIYWKDATFSDVLQYLRRGTRGKDGNEYLRYVPLKDIDDSWLEAIIDYEREHRPENPFLYFYGLEKNMRINLKDLSSKL